MGETAQLSEFDEALYKVCYKFQNLFKNSIAYAVVVAYCRIDSLDFRFC